MSEQDNNQPAERELRVVLSTGEIIKYLPTHTPVNKQDGEVASFMWEQEDGAIFSVSINIENIVALEMVTRREDQGQKVLDLIEEAKGLDSGGGPA